MTHRNDDAADAAVPTKAKPSAAIVPPHVGGTQDAGLALPELMSTKDVCARFNRSSRTIRSWCRTGRLDPVRVGKAVFFRSTDIARMILGDPPSQ